MRSTTDNTDPYAHNWIDRLRSQIENIPTSDGEVVEDLPREATMGFVSESVRALAAEKRADFDVLYMPSGFTDPSGGWIVPIYESGERKGKPKDQYLLRADTWDVVGNMSGSYPTRDGYKHVFDTLDSMFPNSCESVSVYGKGERVVVEQVLAEPFDLGCGDLFQPDIYTRTWKTEIIPISRRISCENMLGHSGQLVGVRATKNHDNILTMRASVVEMSMAQGEALKRMAQTLKDQDFTDQMFKQMLDNLFPAPEPDAHGRTVSAWENKRGACAAMWKEESQRGYPTMWNAYNALQGAEQHYINAGYDSDEKAQQRSITKALEGKTPIADAAERYLMDLVLAEEPF